MTNDDVPAPDRLAEGLADLDLPILREHVREVTRWVIGDAVGDQLGPDRSDALAEEIALILATGLAPVLRHEIDQQAEKKIAGLQKEGPGFLRLRRRAAGRRIHRARSGEADRRCRGAGRHRHRPFPGRAARDAPADAPRRACEVTIVLTNA